MIPGIAVKQVEVLRDGAAAQYGSDAIAGVINFVMKDASEGGSISVKYGEHYEGESSVKVAINAGMAAGDNGFINVSAEFIDNEALSRGIQRPVAQALIDAGVPDVGTDAPFGDAPFVQTWGRPQTKGMRFFLNSGFEVSDTANLYARFSYADTEGRYRFFFRHPTDHTVFASQRAFGDGCPTCDPDDPNDTMNLREQGFVGLPGGFTPILDGNQIDSSLVMGLEGAFESGMLYDFSFGFGKNELGYILNNTANQSLGPGDLNSLPQMDFDVGGYEQKELNVNADFSVPLSDAINLGFGAEWREETYTAVAGEPTSYQGAGASGLKGVTDVDAGANSRDNVAVYADVEYDISDAFLLQTALRFEDFSDFGSTINWKVAGRYRISDGFAFRGGVSTGFHAPTPGQANVRTTITTADSISGMLVEEGLFPPTDPAAIAVGGKALTEETSLNLSIGFTADIGQNSTLTVDLYQIEVDDRIYKTGNIPDPSTGGSIAFYTNALDIEHSGLDVVFTTGFDWSDTASTDVSFAFAYTEAEVTGQTAVDSPTGPILPVSSANIEDIENNYPNERFVLSANTFFGDKLNLMIRANYYGDHWDERGEIGVPGNLSAKIDSTIYFDVDVGYHITDNWKLNVGAINIFDEFVDEIGPPHANRLSVGLPYPRRSAANYEGGQFYLRMTYAY